MRVGIIVPTSHGVESKWVKIGKTPRKMPGRVNARNLVSASWVPDPILGLGNTAVNKIKHNCFFVAF